MEVDAYGWDAKYGRPVLLATEPPNTGIFRQLGAPSDFDVVVVIAHWVLGDGTLDEYQNARAGWERTRESAQPYPQILVFEKKAPVAQSVLDHHDYEAHRQRAVDFLAEVRGPGPALDGWAEPFDDSMAFAQLLEAALRAVAQDKFALQNPHAAPVETWRGDPFIGLRVMRIEHGPIFHGRAEKTQEALRLLKSGPCVALVGPSGTGKSSLAQAGVLYRLTVDQPGAWNTVVFRPGDAGGDPFVAAGTALAQCQADGFSQVEREAVSELTGDGAVAWLSERVATCLGADAGTRDLAIVIDQFEELATACPSNRADLFRQAIVTLAGPDAPREIRDRLRIVISLRDDFMSLIGDRLEPLFSSRTVFVSPPTPRELIAMIREPARIAMEVDDVDDALLDRLVGDTQGVAGGLPLVALALREMLVTAQGERRTVDEPIRLTQENYDAIGGTHGLVERLVRGKMRQLRITRSDTLHQVFRGLIQLNTAYRPTRKRLILDDTIDEEVRRLLNAFAEARLITIDQGTAELGHDGLLDAWDELRDWIAENEEDLFDARALDTRAQAWARRGRPDDRLLTRLALVEDSRRVRDTLPHAFPKSGLVDEYLDRSEQLCRRESLTAAILGGDLTEMVRQLEAGATLEIKDARKLPELAYYWAVMGVHAGQQALSTINRQTETSSSAPLDREERALPVDLALDRALEHKPGFRRAARGITPMHVAAALGYSDVIQALEQGGFNINALSDNGRSPINVAAGYGHFDVVDYLLANERIEVDQATIKGWSPFMMAASQGHLNVVNRLLATEQVEVDRTTDDGTSAFIAAANQGHVDVVNRLLADERVQVDRTTDDGWSAVMLAAGNGHIDVVNRLLADEQVQIDRTNDIGMSALTVAAGNGYTDVVDRLLADQRVDINRTTDKGVSAFLLAASQGHHDVVDRLLADKRLSADQTTEDGWSALLVAASKGHLEVVDRLRVDERVQIDRTTDDGWSAFMLAAGNGHVDVVDRLLADERIEVDRTTDDGWSAFMRAAGSGHLDVVNRLLTDERTEVNRTTDKGMTALMRAAGNGHLDVVNRLLVDERVEVNRTNGKGANAFMMAAARGYFDVVDRLIADERVEVNHVSDDGVSAFMLAADDEHLDVFNRLLTDRRIEVDRTTDGGISIFMLAASNGHLGIVDRLIADDRVDVDRTTDGGVSALMLAASSGHVGIVDRLLADDRVDVDRTTDDGWSAFILAAQNGYLEVVKRLLTDPRVEIDRTTRIGTSAFMHAAFHGHFDIVERLLAEKQIDVQRKSSIGVNALMAAASWGHSDIAKLLIETAPDILNSTDNSGRELIDFAAAPWIVFVEPTDPADERFHSTANDRAEVLDLLLPFAETSEQVAAAIRHGGPHLHAAPAERLARRLQPAVETCLAAPDGDSETVGLRVILSDIAATEHSPETSAVFDAAWPVGWRDTLRGSTDSAAAT